MDAAMHAPSPPIVKKIKTRWSELDQDASEYMENCRKISEYILPRRSFDLYVEPGSLRKTRTLIDTTAVTANERAAALLHGYMMSPYYPWVRPKLVSREHTREESLWFQHAQRGLFETLQSPSSAFRTASHESLLDDTALGTSIMFDVRPTAGAMPVTMALPLSQCRIAENDEGTVDTLYRRFPLRLARAAKLYPNAIKLADKASKSKDGNEVIWFISAVEPRMGGLPGSIGIKKPFASFMICDDTDELIYEKGFDRFPYIVTRLMKRAGDPYGYGWGQQALPLAILLNKMVESSVRDAELKANPPKAVFTNRFGTLDQRPGAVNKIDAADLLLMQPKDLIQNLYEGGDVRVAVEFIRDVRDQIDKIFYVDWLSLNTRGNATATEVLEKRDIRLRSMTPIVSRGESEKLNATAERRFQLLQDSNYFNRPPDSLDNEEIGFEYVSPLAQAQRLSELETFETVMGMTERAAALDEEAADVLDVPEFLRDTYEAAGLQTRHTRSRQELDQRRKERQQRIEQQEQAQLAQQGAQAARDGAQAAASLGLGASPQDGT